MCIVANITSTNEQRNPNVHISWTAVHVAAIKILIKSLMRLWMLLQSIDAAFTVCAAVTADVTVKAYAIHTFVFKTA